MVYFPILERGNYIQNIVKVIKGFIQQSLRDLESLRNRLMIGKWAGEEAGSDWG